MTDEEPFKPAPILHPFHKNRAKRGIICPVCGRFFYPWAGGSAKFCTNRCSGRARTLGLHAASQRPRRGSIYNDGIGTPDEAPPDFERRLKEGDWYGRED